MDGPASEEMVYLKRCSHHGLGIWLVPDQATRGGDRGTWGAEGARYSG